jgi:hypothetical protein
MQEEEEEGAVLLIKKREGGPKTAGPRRFASRAATVRTTGRHVARKYTRKNKKPHGGTHRSEVASGIRSGAFNERAGVEAK